MRAETGHNGDVLLNKCNVVPILNGSVFEALIWTEIEFLEVMLILSKQRVVSGLNFRT